MHTYMCTHVYLCSKHSCHIYTYMHAYVCVYIYILLHVQRYIHVQNIHVHTVCTYRGMCACAPCPPQHDSLLTPPLQQHERTPLYISAFHGHTNTVLALLQAGAAVDAKNEVRGALRSLMSRALALPIRLRAFRLCKTLVLTLNPQNPSVKSISNIIMYS
jgi:hypothetical protein